MSDIFKKQSSLHEIHEMRETWDGEFETTSTKFISNYFNTFWNIEMHLMWLQENHTNSF